MPTLFQVFGLPCQSLYLQLELIDQKTSFIFNRYNLFCPSFDIALRNA